MKTLLTEEQLRQGIDRLAGEIRQHYQGRPLTIVGVLIGSVVLLADLIRRLDNPLRVELIQARNHRQGSTRPGPLVIDLDLLSSDVRGRDVLLVDDIFHTGNTLWELLPQIDELGPASVRTAVLLRKAGQMPGAASSPTSWASTSPTPSSSATAWTTATGTAIFPTWPPWSRSEMKEEPGR